MTSGVALVARRTIRAAVQTVFEAWTQPEQLRAWWGPRPVTCTDAEVDLRVGGQYRIVNALPKGGRVTIYGEFRIVEVPNKLVYTWRVSDTTEVSLVTVRFESRGDATEVIVVHEDISDEPLRDSHESGWKGCLDGLQRHIESS